MTTLSPCAASSAMSLSLSSCFSSFNLMISALKTLLSDSTCARKLFSRSFASASSASKLFFTASTCPTCPSLLRAISVLATCSASFSRSSSCRRLFISLFCISSSLFSSSAGDLPPPVSTRNSLILSKSDGPSYGITRSPPSPSCVTAMIFGRASGETANLSISAVSVCLISPNLQHSPNASDSLSHSDGVSAFLVKRTGLR
mmetsp:Transcript_46463/g.145709  ORF Transcript_46463/g.145709 Transcript_46463/m.145709 type:complete len:202 (+) Transcript_46463:421-1026(+)